MGRRKKAAKKPARDHLIRSESHDIDNRAQALFQVKCPLHWVTNDLKDRDYGKDYHIEVGNRNDRRIGGDLIYIQLKGVAGGNYRQEGAVITQAIEKRHLTHWCDDVKPPVFLLVVDVQTGKGYWLFLQEYLEEHREWRTQKSYTVHVPVENCWDDIDKWETEIRRAIKQMRARATTIQEVMQGKVARLEKIDPRFEVRPHITRDGERYDFVAKELVNFKMVIEGSTPERHSQALACMGKGKPFRLTREELTLTGSPLFEDWKDGEAVIQVKTRLDATATLICQDGQGKETARLSNICGAIEGGLSERHFTTNAANKLPYSLRLGPMTDNSPIRMNVACSCSVWEDKPILDLHDFDETYKFTRALEQSGRIVMECRHDNSLLFKLRPDGLPLGDVPGLVWCLEVIRKAREVARKIGRNPALARTWIEDDRAVRDILIVHGLLKEGVYRFEKGTTYELTTSLSKDQLKLQPLDMKASDVIVSDSGRTACTFFGEPVAVGPIGYDLRNATPRLAPEELRRRMKDRKKDVKVTFRVPPNGEFVIRKLSDDEIVEWKRWQ